MTPSELKAARHALGLSTEGFAKIGLPFGYRIAESGRTVRRWESGDRDIPGPVLILVHLMLRSPTVRRLLGVTKSEK